MKYYSAIRKNNFLPFVTTCMDLESIMLSEISDMEKNKSHMISLIFGYKKKATNEQNQKTHRYNSTHHGTVVTSGAGA